MKKIILLFSLLCFSRGFTQTVTERWNNLSNRYEYTNSSGQLVGYKQYNSLQNVWQYYEVPAQSQYQQPTSQYDFELLYKAMAYKQGQYDNNSKALNDYISSSRTYVESLSIPADNIQNIKDRMNAEYIDTLRKNSYDLSNSQTFNNIMQWLSTGLINVVKEEISKYQQQQEIIQQAKQQALSEINYHAGGYTTNQVVTEKYNPYTKQYEVVSVDTTPSKIYLMNGCIYYFRNSNSGWKAIPWIFSYSDTVAHTLNDTVGYTLITIAKNIEYVVFLENPVGGRFAERYTYKNLKKDSTIKKPF